MWRTHPISKLFRERFQFLIGRLETFVALRDGQITQFEFQFLIGRLETRLLAMPKEVFFKKFQFLIGRLQTKRNRI
ncbi:hypothetical protein BBF96_03265 [Anoxybacter fermentans]|uniref:Uncharacterized protein n=1 Tax=Anoxybacter fermentans TaxID=1323375 RepID=A0A3Q9HP98_9FIRM|nr:hypothetical protein BBF96_03265 [Anoxybacter fermentans]